MKYCVKLTESFKRRLKKLTSKYPRIKNDLSELLDDLEQGTFQGDRLQNYPGEVYKVRIGSIDQKRGKRGGFRVVYIVVTLHQTAYLVEMYAKASQEDLTEKQRQGIEDLIRRFRQKKS